MKDHISAEIAKIYNQNVIVKIRISKGRSKPNDIVQAITPPDIGTKIADSEIDLFKKGQFNINMLKSKRM